MAEPSELHALRRPYYEPLELDGDIRITELIRALAVGGFCLTNVPDRGLRIVRAPTPGEETRNVD